MWDSAKNAACEILSGVGLNLRVQEYRKGIGGGGGAGLKAFGFLNGSETLPSANQASGLGAADTFCLVMRQASCFVAVAVVSITNPVAHRNSKGIDRAVCLGPSGAGAKGWERRRPLCPSGQGGGKRGDRGSPGP